MISNAKLKQFEQMPQRESIHHRFKESCFWDFSDGLNWKDDCNGYHYFDRIIDKYIDKPFSHVIHKCRTHKSYNHRNGFKRQVNERIREYMRRPELKRYPYSGSPNYEGKYFGEYMGGAHDYFTLKSCVIENDIVKLETLLNDDYGTDNFKFNTQITKCQ